MATTYQIDSSLCIMCGACEVECEHGAISEGADSYVIDSTKCTGCGTCSEACPQEAISPAA